MLHNICLTYAMSIWKPFFNYLKLWKFLILLMTLLNKCLCPKSAFIITFYNNLWLKIWFLTIISFKCVRWMFSTSIYDKVFIIYTWLFYCSIPLFMPWPISYGPYDMNDIIWIIWYGLHIITNGDTPYLLLNSTRLTLRSNFCNGW